MYGEITRDVNGQGLSQSQFDCEEIDAHCVVGTAYDWTKVDPSDRRSV